MKVVVVESPAKAKTINKYLGPGYTVLASFGHVRDLREKDGAVEPDSDFTMHWEVGERAKKPLGEITKALKKGDTVTLVGFGTFSIRKRAARTGRNPRTGQTIKIKASKNPAFKAGKALKDAVN